MFSYMDTNMTMFHGLGMFIFWIILLYLLFAIFSKNKKHKETALDILKKRLANGEISKEEYESIKKTIKGEI